MFDSMKKTATYNLDVAQEISKDTKAISLKELNEVTTSGKLLGFRSGNSRGYDYIFILVVVNGVASWVSLPKSYKAKFEGCNQMEIDAMVNGRVMFTNLRVTGEFMGHDVYSFDLVTT